MPKEREPEKEPLSKSKEQGRYPQSKTKSFLTLSEKRFFKWEYDNKSVTLRNKSGSYGGGSEVLVIEHVSENMRNDRHGNQNTDSTGRDEWGADC